jgi:hypothetical protein
MNIHTVSYKYTYFESRCFHSCTSKTSWYLAATKVIASLWDKYSFFIYSIYSILNNKLISFSLSFSFASRAACAAFQVGSLLLFSRACSINLSFSSCITAFSLLMLLLLLLSLSIVIGSTVFPLPLPLPIPIPWLLAEGCPQGRPRRRLY